MNDNCVTEVYHSLIRITSEIFPGRTDSSDPPFLFLEGSSGSGKTQMGFTIKAKIGQIRQVYYFLFEPPGPSAQQIYLNFAEISRLFTKCCSADKDVYSTEATSPTCGSLSNQQLYVYGFLYELLNEGASKSSVRIISKTGKDVLKLMRAKRIHQNRPVFILDECIVTTEEHLKKLRFVRNCFRSLGLGLVMLGTDSSAAKLPSTIGGSSRTDTPRVWCHVIGKFPVSRVSLLGLPESPLPWLQYILVKSRPLFAQLVADNLKKRPSSDFDQLMKDVFTDLVNVKKIFGNHHGKLGQLRLFQNAHYPLEDWEDDSSTPLIHSHFAQLNGDQKNFELMNNGCIKNNDEIWKPSSAFPKVEDDILLYLLLMGGKHHPAFRLNGITVPYSHFLMNIKGDTDYRSHILDVSNAVQVNNDGMFLESLLCTTVCLASHSNGVKGIGLNKFLLNLVYQLQIDKLESKDIIISGLELLARSLSGIPFTVPFLSPANQRWPGDLQIPASNFGFLERTKNKDKIDLRTSCGLVGESKDYGTEINITTMRQILTRFPKNAKVELVFVRKLQNSYFNHPAKSFAVEFKGSHLLNTSFYKIDCSKPQTSLEQIPGLPFGKSGGIVIFFEVNGSIKL